METRMDLTQIFITPMNFGFSYWKSGEYAQAASYIGIGLIPYIVLLGLLYFIFDLATRSRAVYMRGNVTRADFVQENEQTDGHDTFVPPPYWRCRVLVKFIDQCLVYEVKIFTEPRLSQDVELRIVTRRMTGKLLSVSAVA